MSAATKAEENAGAIVYEVLGRRALDVDTTIIDYIINVLKDESFDFGDKGEGAYQAVGDLLVDSGCVDDEPEARLICEAATVIADSFHSVPWISRETTAPFYMVLELLQHLLNDLKSSPY